MPKGLLATLFLLPQLLNPGLTADFFNLKSLVLLIDAMMQRETGTSHFPCSFAVSDFPFVNGRCHI